MAEALEADRRPEVVALAGVVEDDVEDDLDPGLVERLDHVAELVMCCAVLGADTVARLRRHMGVGVVAPDSCCSSEPSIGLMPRTLALVEGEDGQQLDRGHAQRLQVGDLLDHAGEGAGVLDPDAGDAVKPRTCIS